MGYYFRGHKLHHIKETTCTVSRDFSEVLRRKITGRLADQCVEVNEDVARRLLNVQIACGYVRPFTEEEIISYEKANCMIGYDDQDGYESGCTCGHH